MKGALEYVRCAQLVVEPGFEPEASSCLHVVAHEA